MLCQAFFPIAQHTSQNLPDKLRNHLQSVQLPKNRNVKRKAEDITEDIRTDGICIENIA